MLCYFFPHALCKAAEKGFPFSSSVFWLIRIRHVSIDFNNPDFTDTCNTHEYTADPRLRRYIYIYTVEPL